MGNVFQCCHVLSNYIRHKDAPARGDAERSPLLSREGSECDSFTPLDNLEEEEEDDDDDDDDSDLSTVPAMAANPTLEQGRFLFPDIILSSSLGGEVSVVEPVVCLLVSEEEEVGLGETGPERGDRGSNRLYAEVETQTDVGTQTGAWLQTLAQPCHAEVQTQTEMPSPSAGAAETRKCAEANTQTKTEMIEETVTERFAGCEIQNQADVLLELQSSADEKTPVLSTEIGPLAETMVLSGKQTACDQLQVQVPAKVSEQRERCTLISGEVDKGVQVEQRETDVQDRLTDVKCNKDTFLKEHSHDPAEEVITNTKQIVHEKTTTMGLNTANEGDQLDWVEHSTFQTQMNVRNAGSPQQAALTPTEHNADDVEQNPDLLQKDTNRSQQNVELPEHSSGKTVQIMECVDHAAPCASQTQQEETPQGTVVGQRAVSWIHENVTVEEDCVISAKLETIVPTTAECTDHKNLNAGESVDQAHQNSIQKVSTVITEHNVNRTHQNAVLQTVHHINGTADHQTDPNIVQTVQDIVQAEHCSPDQADLNIVPSKNDDVDQVNEIVETEHENPEPDQSTTAEPTTVDKLDETVVQDAVELEGSGSQVKEERLDEAKQVTLFLVDRLFLATPHVKVPPIEHVKTSLDATSKEFDEDKGEGLSIQEVVSLQEAVLTIRIQSPGTETFEIQISGQILVAELNQVLMDHELTCHRTCFSLHLGGAVLDNLVELHSVPGIQDGALIKVVEETYTVRDARLHLRHVRDLLRSLDPTDAHNGVNGSSLSYLSIYTEEQTDKESGGKRRASEKETMDCSPPDYILPGCKECPLTPLQPVRNSWKPLQCLRVLTMSSWNPPPGNRKMHGDLMYINVVTMEDRDLNITSSTRGFYLNQSTAFTFNPKPALPKILCHSLVELLSQVSPAFRKHYSALQKKRVQRHPYERIVTPYQVYTWTAPHGDHALDWVRAEETHTVRMGQDEHTAGQSRDWNEELQCCRELPRNTVQERLQRERNIFKTNSDFVGAATQGAMAVVDGNVMAINPGEAPHMQMFIWNSMFFSLGFDISDHYRPLGGNAAAHTAANCDQRGVQAYASVDTEGLHTLGTAVVDYRGYRVIAQTIVAGILEKSQDESVVYGSNDHGKTVLSHPRFMELLEKTSGPLRLHRHSVLDHNDSSVELYSSIDTKGILGNDGRHYVLDLLRTFPRDLNFLLSEEEKGEVPAECRSFGYPRRHRHSLAALRPELIDAFVQHRYELFLKMVSQGFRQLGAGPESQEGVGQSEDMAWSEHMVAEDLVKILGETGDTAPDRAGLDGQRREMIMKACKAAGSVSDSHFDIRFNPDVCCAGVRFPSECAEELQRQKQLLWDAAAFLLSNQIPAVLRDCLDQTVVPMDGATLTLALHQRGVSVRYLGTLLELLERAEEKERLSHVERIAISEMVIRSSKHIFKIYLQDVEPAAFSAAVSHFLNCLLSPSSLPDSGSDELLSRRRGRRRRAGSHGSRVAMLADSVWARLTPGDLWVRVRKEAEEYYHYTLCSDSTDDLIEKYSLQKISLLREMTTKTGIQVQLREYAFDSRHRPVFGEEDVVNMFPVVKHLRSTSSDATRLVQRAQVAVQQGLLKDGYEMISQALTLFSTVCGVLHEDMCTCLRLMGRISYILGEYQDALSHQEKVAMVSERVLGIDHPQTTQDYTYLALYCFAGRQHSTSLHLLYRARYLTLLVSGEDHPQLALLDSMLGLVLHGLMEYDLSLKFLQNALTLTAKFHGAKSVKHAHSHHLLATVFESKGEFRSALQHEKEAYSIYKDQVGESHESTKESSEYLKRLTQQAVILQKAINHIYSNTSSACIPPPKFSTPSLPTILQQLNLTCGIIFVPLRAKELGDLTRELKGIGGTAQALDVDNQQTLKHSRSADD